MIKVQLKWVDFASFEITYHKAHRMMHKSNQTIVNIPIVDKFIKVNSQ